MPTNVATGFPNYEAELRTLVRDHKELKDEPLILALYYAPQRDPDDIFLFEVIKNFGANSIDPDRTLFEVAYGSTSGFPLAPGQHLRLVLTNPDELKAALREEWPLATELRDVLRSGKAMVLLAEEEGQRLLELIRG